MLGSVECPKTYRHKNNRKTYTTIKIICDKHDGTTGETFKVLYHPNNSPDSWYTRTITSFCNNFEEL